MAEKKEEKNIDFCLDWIKKINDSLSTLNSERKLALTAYAGDSEIVPTSSGRSKAVTTDVMDAIEWLKPSLLEIFAGGNEILSLQPTSSEDVENVKKLEMFVNYQLKIKNPWFLILYDVFDDMAKLKTGVIKYQWIEKSKKFEKSYKGLNVIEYQAKISEPNVYEIKEIIVDVDNITGEESYTCTIEYEIKDVGPVIEAVPTDEFGFEASAKSLNSFCYHKVELEKWKIIDSYGQEKYNLIKGLENKEDDITTDLHSERIKDLCVNAYNEKKKTFIVYECYYEDVNTGEAKILTLCGNFVLFEGKNQYDKPPFIVITPVRIAHRLIGLSQYDLNKDTQKIRTAMLRQFLDSIYFANNPRYFGDPSRVNLTDYLENNGPNAFIRTKGDPNAAIRPEDKARIPVEAFQLWEMMNTEKDYHSGIPRSFQGVNPRELNKTWRGQSQQVNQASQRISMMARLIAESGIIPLVNAVIDLNLKFLQSETAFRYLNEDIVINPDNIIGKYDVIVNVGTGTKDNEKTVLQMQQLIGLYLQFLSAGIPVANVEDAYHCFKELIKAMGNKNVDDFSTDPKMNELVKQLMIIINQYGLTKNPQIAQIVMKLSAMMGLNRQTPSSSKTESANIQPPPQPEQAMNPISAMEGAFNL